VISCVAGWVGAKNTSIQEHQQRGPDVICNKRVAPHGTAILNTINILQGIKL
jgi:hydrogenase maturation factor